MDFSNTRVKPYTFTIKYCKGVDNSIADTLSRYVPEEFQEYHEAIEECPKIINIAFAAPPDVISMLKDITDWQFRDIRIRRIKEKITVLENPQYCILNNVVYKLYRGQWKILLPEAALENLAWACHHSLAHASPLKCTQVVQEDLQ